MATQDINIRIIGLNDLIAAVEALSNGKAKLALHTGEEQRAWQFKAIEDLSTIVMYNIPITISVNAKGVYEVRVMPISGIRGFTFEGSLDSCLRRARADVERQIGGAQTDSRT